MRLFALLLLASLFQVNEAIASVTSVSSSLEIEIRAREAQRDKIAAAMTYENAMSIMESSRRAPANFLKMLQENIGDAKKKHNKKSLRKDAQKTSPGGVPPGAAGNSQSDYNGGVWNALYKINDMLLETV